LALILAAMAAAFLFSTITQVGALRFVNPRCSAFMLWSFVEDGRGPLWVRWRDLDGISPHLAQAVLAAEDQRFFDHEGFDWVEIEKALDQAQKGKKPRGASTISMQTARNLFLWEGRSYIRKGLEAWYTVVLETLLPKRRILEIYLNVAQFGPDLYGAEAAAQKYWRRSPDQLTSDMAARLAVVLPAPSKRSPLALPRHLMARKSVIQKQMGGMSLEELKD
jgi:monofunctional biosynthetic peptidoglycan transglycosylase